jgi:hypothetical protein
MPLVPRRQHSTAFLYRSERNAELDKNFCAMGFFVGIQSVHLGHYFQYMVTNEHVVRGLKSVFARVHMCRNESLKGHYREPDDLAIVEIPVKEFVTNRANDLAAVQFHLAPNPAYLIHYTPIEDLVEDFRGLGPREMRDRDIPFVGVGDEVFMLSRVCQKGVHYRKENLHIARFGNVALVPKHEEPFFLAEMRSIAGHSGSPVWAILPGFHNEPKWNICGSPARHKHFGLRLLGINSGHLPEYESIVALDPAGGQPTKHTRWMSEGHTAIAQVVPAWLIAELLDCDKFATAREKGDAAIDRHQASIVKDRAQTKSGDQPKRIKRGSGRSARVGPLSRPR